MEVTGKAKYIGEGNARQGKLVCSGGGGGTGAGAAEAIIALGGRTGVQAGRARSQAFLTKMISSPKRFPCMYILRNLGKLYHISEKMVIWFLLACP